MISRKLPQQIRRQRFMAIDLQIEELQAQAIHARSGGQSTQTLTAVLADRESHSPDLRQLNRNALKYGASGGGLCWERAPSPKPWNSMSATLVRAYLPSICRACSSASTVSKGTLSRVGGTGLGLAIVNTLCAPTGARSAPKVNLTTARCLCSPSPQPDQASARLCVHSPRLLCGISPLPVRFKIVGFCLLPPISQELRVFNHILRKIPYA